jgi:hypothetical protein
VFHWICPECGREIAPTIRECPACDPAAATVDTALAGEVEASACAEKEAVAPDSGASVPAAGRQTDPEPYQAVAPSVAATLTAETVAGTAVAEPAVTAPAETAPADAATTLTPTTLTATAVAEPVDGPTPALAARIESASPLAARSSQSFAKHDAGEDALLPQFGASSADGDPLEHLSSMLVSSMLDSKRDTNPPEPPPSQDALPLPLCAAPRVPASLRAFIAELRPAGTELHVPLPPTQSRQAAPAPPLLTTPLPLPLRSSPQTPEPPLGAKLLALPLSPEVARPSTPSWEPAPQMAPLGNYSPLEGRPLCPAAPTDQLLKKECGPRTTLPGPMLTRRLVKFLDRELNSIPPVFLVVKKRLIPGWMATALIMGTLLGAGFTSVISVVRPAAEANAPAAAAQTNTPATPVASTPDVSSAGASPLAKAIEVTGFRIQVDPAKKSEIQYLVVNHSPARFSGVTVYVTLYAADAKAGQPPLCRFQFTAPDLAPFQAKDMTSAIERPTRPVSAPDWQDLRASVEIGE